MEAQRVSDQSPLAASFSSEANPLQFSITLNATGLLFMRLQLERDIASSQRTLQTGFTPKQMRLMQIRLTRHWDGQAVGPRDNIVLTYEEHSFLLIYASQYLKLALKREDIIQSGVYDDLVYQLGYSSMLTNRSGELPLDLTYYGVHSVTRPLVALWDRVCAVVGRPNRPEIHSFNPFTVA